MNTFFEEIKEKRKEIGLSIEELAIRLAVSPETIKSWEYRRIIPSKEYIMPLCDQLGLLYSKVRQLWLDEVLPLPEKELILIAQNKEKFKEVINNPSLGLSEKEKTLLLSSFMLANYWFDDKCQIEDIRTIIKNDYEIGSVALARFKESKEGKKNRILVREMTLYYEQLKTDKMIQGTKNKLSNVLEGLENEEL